MRSQILSLLAGALVLTSACARRPAPPLDVAPPAKARTTPFPGERIGIVGEAYIEAEKNTYTDAARDLVTDAFLEETAFAPGNFKPEVKFFASEQSGRPGMDAGRTRFKLRWNGSPRSCYVDVSDKAMVAIFDTLKTTEVDTSVVVINSGAYGGCAKGSFIFVGNVASPPAWTVMAHEFGHRLGLRDERVDFYSAHPHSQNYISPGWNCSSCKPKQVWWRRVLGTTPLEGCDRYESGIYRPSNDCRMSYNTGRPFCAVCQRLLARKFNVITTPLPTCSTQPVKGLQLDPKRLLDRIDRIDRSDRGGQAGERSGPQSGFVQALVKISSSADRKSIRVLSWSYLDGVVTPSITPDSPHLYAIRLASAKEWQYGEFFKVELFTQRSYGAEGKHATLPAESVSVIVKIPNPLADALRKGEAFSMALFETNDVDAFYRVNIEPRALQSVSLGLFIDDLLKDGLITRLWQEDGLRLPPLQ